MCNFRLVQQSYLPFGHRLVEQITKVYSAFQRDLSSNFDFTAVFRRTSSTTRSHRSSGSRSRMTRGSTSSQSHLDLRYLARAGEVEVKI